MTNELPANFRPPTYEYDGTTDPLEHLRRFENSALLHYYFDRVKCWVFFTMPTKSAQQWLWQLRADTIHSFEDFNNIFLHQFTIARKNQKTILALFSLKQKENERLRSYVKRFTSAALDIPSATQEVLVKALAQSL